MAKDLGNARALATLLEAQYADLRTADVPPAGVGDAADKAADKATAAADAAAAAAPPSVEGVEAKPAAPPAPKTEDGDGDAQMAEPGAAPAADGAAPHADPLPPIEYEAETAEMGSPAVERRAQRLLEDAISSGAMDGGDARAVAEAKVPSL
jgi:hypothetical protein